MNIICKISTYKILQHFKNIAVYLCRWKSCHSFTKHNNKNLAEGKKTYNSATKAFSSERPNKLKIRATSLTTLIFSASTLKRKNFN